jgi:hypothetical protein
MRLRHEHLRRAAAGLTSKFTDNFQPNQQVPSEFTEI